MQFSLRKLFLWQAIVAIIVFAVLAVGRSYRIEDGSYDLAISIVSRENRPVQWVYCVSFPKKEYAKYVEETSWRQLLEWPKDKEFWPGTIQPVILSIRFSTHTNHFGVQTADYQNRFLAVRVHYQDGEEVGRAVEIPHRKDARSITVEVP